MSDELTSRIFSRAEGLCLSSLDLKERYQRSVTKVYETNEIAHLASCKACLDLASAYCADVRGRSDTGDAPAAGT
jgi:hypothetical protein